MPWKSTPYLDVLHINWCRDSQHFQNFPIYSSSCLWAVSRPKPNDKTIRGKLLNAFLLLTTAVIKSTENWATFRTEMSNVEKQFGFQRICRIWCVPQFSNPRFCQPRYKIWSSTLFSFKIYKSSHSVCIQKSSDYEYYYLSVYHTNHIVCKFPTSESY